MIRIRHHSFILIASAFVLYSLLLFGSKVDQAFAQNQASQRADEYYPHHPTGCRYIKKLDIEHTSDYFFVAPCSRDDRMWLQEVTVIETSVRGVIYLPGESLINGVTLDSAYWCSLQAPGFENVGVAGTCTKDGWIPKISR